MFSVTQALSNLASLQQPLTQRAESEPRDKDAASRGTERKPDAEDTVSISEEALRTAETATLSAEAAYWQPFYPGRDGFSTANLAAAVVDPGAQPFSQNRAFADVAEAARQSIDSRYRAMDESGQPFRWSSQEGGGTLDINAAFGELDRRALYAVSSNEGGLFTRREQMAATDLMRQQQGNAMGFGSGPNEVARKHVDIYQSDHEGRYKAMNRFLDAVSIEEQATSVEWAQQRASGQSSVENLMRERGETPEPFNTENSLLAMMLEAMDDFRSGRSDTPIDVLDKESPFMIENQDRIARAIEENKRTLLNISA